jgi:hypothetical protein
MTGTATPPAGANANRKRGRGRPFEPGNPGKPKGTRHKATLAMEALLDGEADKLTRKAVEMALAGDGAALRLCIDRILPPRKDRPVSFELPQIRTAADALVASGALVEAVAAGTLTPTEASEVGKLVDIHVRTLEATEFERRLAALEAKGGAK